MRKTILLIAASTLLAACEYVPRKVYNIRTEDGQVLKMACPTIDPLRSKFSFVYDGPCILVK